MKDREVGGAVYVYINQAGWWEGVTPIRLNGTKDSMFGLAVENIGDINQDSHEGNLPVIVWLIFIFCTCKANLIICFFCLFFLTQTLQSELLMMTVAQERSTFITALYKELKPGLHRSAFV